MIKARRLTPKAYGAYGDVIAARGKPVAANQGTARRYNFLAALENLRPAARPNLCLYRCRPRIKAGTRAFAVRLLERHPHSTQAFIPLDPAARYLVIVALGQERPDPATLSAFVASRSQGITYKPGVWHHPLVAIHRSMDFACLVWEDGGPGDCEETPFKAEIEL